MPSQTKALYPFGCLAFKHVSIHLRTKLDAHAAPMVYLGVDPASRSYLLGSLYDLSTSVAVEVTFLENVFPFRKFKASDSPASLLWGTDSTLQQGDPRLGMFATDTDSVVPILDRHALKSLGALPVNHFKEPPDVAAMQETSSAGADPPDDENDRAVTFKLPNTAKEESSVEVRRSMRERSIPVQTNQRFRDPNAPAAVYSCASGPSESLQSILVVMTEASLQSITPTNAYAAVKSQQRSQWLAAMNREKDCHLKNGTFGTAQPINSTAKAIPADWVFKIKHRGGPIDVDGLESKQFKARVVVRGQFMKEGVNFNDTFAPVAKQVTVRATLAFAAKHSLLIKCGDVETAFLTATMDCEVWVKMPPFWGEGEAPVCTNNPPLTPKLLLKGVPGIPQGSRLFYEKFTAHLESLGFLPSLADKCLYFNPNIKEKHAVLIWVDDFVAVHEKEQTFSDLLSDLRKAFTITCVGPLRSFLGMIINYDAAGKKMWITQTNAIDVLLERAKMTGCNPASSPCPPGFVFSKKDCPQAATDNSTTSEFRSLIALANFISCWTRPDITFTVNKLCKYMSNPGAKHWGVLKQLIRYLNGTRLTGLHYDFGSGQLHSLRGFTDSSFADCVDSGRSTIAYSFFLGPAIISWYSKLNSYVTTCTNHSEYTALAHGAKECEWLVTLFKQLDGGYSHTPVPIFVDNSGTVAMVFNPVDHKSNKHVKIACHYTRELVADKILAPIRIPTADNIADIFTKPLGSTVFAKLSSTIVSAAPSSESIFMLSGSPASAESPETEPLELMFNQHFPTHWSNAHSLMRELGATSYSFFPNSGVTAQGKPRTDIEFKSGERIISRHIALARPVEPANQIFVYRIPKWVPPGSSLIPHPPYAEILKPLPKEVVHAFIREINGVHTGPPVPIPGLTPYPDPDVHIDWDKLPLPDPVDPGDMVRNVRPRLADSKSSDAVDPMAVYSSMPPSFMLAPEPMRGSQNLTPSQLIRLAWSARCWYKPPMTRESHYHRLDCSHLHADYELTTLQLAHLRGLTPVLHCCFSFDPQ